MGTRRNLSTTPAFHLYSLPLFSQTPADFQEGTPEQIPKSLLLRIFKFSKAIIDFFFRLCPESSEQLVPDNEISPIIRISIESVTVVVYFMHVGCYQDPTEQLVNP